MGPHPNPTYAESAPEDPAQAANYWCQRINEEIANAFEISEEMNAKVGRKSAFITTPASILPRCFDRPSNIARSFRPQ